MKLGGGSLQRKRRRWYWVAKVNGRQKWLPLKTEDAALARLRARKLAATIRSDDAASETAWLEQLVRLGDEARARLAQLRTGDDLAQRDLWSVFLARTPKPIPSASRENYKHWLDLLASDKRMASPAALTADAARQIASDLRTRYVSADRMIAFFRRVWRVLGLDAAIWNGAGASDTATDASPDCADAHEFYRRLSHDEVKRLLAYLKNRAASDDAAYSDMIVIGYYTGLRLSDVAELNRDEVSDDVRFLSLQPNKTRHHRHRLVRIPLVDLARVRIRARLISMDADGYLFSKRTRRRPSCALGRIFRASGVVKQGNGRASFHSLHATFISLMDEAGVPPHVTDAITGHAGGGMHARYTQPSDAALAAAVTRAIPPL